MSHKGLVRYKNDFRDGGSSSRGGGRDDDRRQGQEDRYEARFSL